MSSSIGTRLKLKNSSKQGESIMKYLPYTMEELKQHLESQFEPWMTWNNRGIYKVNEWNDNNELTWKWQIDHIMPASTFIYKSMDYPEFQKCWALSNLRPYSAKQNLLDGANRTRHNKKAE